MKLFGKTVMLELQEKEWKDENSKSPIIRPGVVADKADGEMKQRVPWHFFRVIDKGPEVTKLGLGDRPIPCAPDLNHQPQIIPVIIWVKGEKVVRYIISEENIGGVE